MVSRVEQMARHPWKQVLELMEVSLLSWKPVGPSLKTLPLQPVYAMTLDLKKKTLRASLDEVAARLMDVRRRREDRLEREPVGPELRKV